tara:strand:- start:643 stop:783 length:141 start_codon:yes stop_codon:yes gene_type:complete
MIGTAFGGLNLRYFLTPRYQYRIAYHVLETTVEIRGILHPRQRPDG